MRAPCRPWCATAGHRRCSAHASRRELPAAVRSRAELRAHWHRARGRPRAELQAHWRRARRTFQGASSCAGAAPGRARARPRL
eukprot:15175528-Heterocapsa_arctica.AAC.1